MAEQDTKELDALLAALNTSAERFQTLWFSFLGLTLYLAIAAMATTNRDLLLRELQVLPLVNIRVQLLPFYVIAPLLYLVFHFYVLMMLVLLGRTAEPFERQLRTTLPHKADQELYRARVENTLFLQTLVGMRGERAGFNGILLKLIALITIVFAPIATLILMQMMFLPYHSFAITWWHRTLVLVRSRLDHPNDAQVFQSQRHRYAPFSSAGLFGGDLLARGSSLAIVLGRSVGR